MKTGIDKEAYRSKIGKVLLFRALADAELQAIMKYFEIISFSPGEIVIGEGDLSPSFFIILEGTVNVTVNQNGKEVFICCIGAGDIFGEAAMFLKVKRTATVTVSEDAIIIKMVRQDMIQYLKEQPIAGNKILLLMIYSLLKKLRDANQELAFERRSDIEQTDVDALISEFSQ